MKTECLTGYGGLQDSQLKNFYTTFCDIKLLIPVCNEPKFGFTCGVFIPCCTFVGGQCLTVLRGQTVAQMLMSHEIANTHVSHP